MLDHRALHGDVGEDVTRNRELSVGEVDGQRLGDPVGAWPGNPEIDAVTFPGDRQSLERNSLSMILFRSTPALPNKARSNPAAAGDMASFIIGRPPGTGGFGRSSAGAAHGRCEGRKRTADRPWPRGRSGLAECSPGARTAQLLSINTQDSPRLESDSAQGLFQCVSYLSRQYPRIRDG
jgi:hypothetical protein